MHQYTQRDFLIKVSKKIHLIEDIRIEMRKQTQYYVMILIIVSIYSNNNLIIIIWNLSFKINLYTHSCVFMMISLLCNQFFKFLSISVYLKNVFIRVLWYFFWLSIILIFVQGLILMKNLVVTIFSLLPMFRILGLRRHFASALWATGCTSVHRVKCKSLPFPQSFCESSKQIICNEIRASNYEFANFLKKSIVAKLWTVCWAHCGQRGRLQKDPRRAS